MSGTREPTEAERDAALAGTRQAYARYAVGPEADRWEALDPGSRLMLDERDRWLVGQLAGRESVLDLGCGDGNLALTMDAARNRPRRYVGIDILPERIEVAKSRVPWGEFAVASADRLPLPDDAADAVVAVTTLSSVPSVLLAGVGVEIGRVLRPGGVLVVYDLRYPSPGNRDVRPVGRRELGRLFPGWPIQSESLTLLPPLARSPLGGGRRRYRLLTAVPLLRSHAGSVLTRP